MTRSRPRACALATMVALGLALAACGGGGGDAADRDSSTTATTETGVGGRTGGTLTVLSSGDVDSLDPGVTYYGYAFTYANAMHRALYAFRPTEPEKPVPDLAAGPPRVSDDGRTITVRLRGGVRFSPPVDREVTSADVRYAIERGFSKNVENPYAGTYFGSLAGLAAFRSGQAKRIAGIETPDDRTIVFRTTTTGPLAAALVMPLTAPVPEEYARRFDASDPSTYAVHQVTTGPYMVEGTPTGTLTGYRPNRSITLVRNPSWDASTDFRPAFLDRIVTRVGNTDSALAARRILEGSRRAAGDFLPEPATLKRFYDRRRDQFEVAAGTGAYFLTMNTTLAPFDDVDVRKAVLAGFDREAIRLARGGALVGSIATHVVNPSTPGFEEAGGAKGPDLDFLANPRGDRAVAAKYFKRAGFASGRYEGDDELFMVDIRGGVTERNAEVARAQLERMGFKVRLRLVSQNAALTKFFGDPKADVHVMASDGFVRDFADAQSILAPLFNGASIAPVNNPNRSQLDVPAINRAMQAASKLVDPDARAAAWGAIDVQVMAQAPVVPLLWDNAIVMHSADVRLVAARSTGGFLDLSSTSLK